MARSFSGFCAGAAAASCAGAEGDTHQNLVVGDLAHVHEGASTQLGAPSGATGCYACGGDRIANDRWHEQLRKSRKPMIELKVMGMTCGGCANSVKRALNQDFPAAAVQVDLGTGTVRIEGDVDVARAVASVQNAGFEVAPAAP